MSQLRASGARRYGFALFSCFNLLLGTQMVMWLALLPKPPETPPGWNRSLVTAKGEFWRARWRLARDA